MYGGIVLICMVVLYLYVLIVFSLHRESLKLILVDEPLPEVVLSHPAQHPTVPRPHQYPGSMGLWLQSKNLDTTGSLQR
jgi:hypothetical protein